MNANTMLMSMKANTLTHFADVNEVLVKVAETLARGENDAKALAKDFAELLDTPNRDLAFIEMGLFDEKKKSDGTIEKKPYDLKKAVNSIYSGVYSGETAYKYAHCYKAFAERPEWEAMNMGKMIILSPMFNTKNIEAGATLEKFYFNQGCDFYRPTKEAHDKWMEDNETILATIAALESAGNTELAEGQRKLLSPEPVIMGYVVDENTGSLVYDVSMCTDKGFDIVSAMSDKELKSKVSKYLESFKPAKGEKDAEGKEDAEKASKEKSIAELKADALAALQAYTAKLDTIPKSLDRAITELAKED